MQMKKIVLAVTACIGLALSTTVSASEFANPFGKASAPVSSKKTSTYSMQASVTSTKRYQDYAAYPIGSDQRKILLIAAIYAARLGRHPDYNGLVYWMSQLNSDLSNKTSVLYTIDSLTGGYLFNPASSSAGVSGNIQNIASMLTTYTGVYFSYGQAYQLYYDPRGGLVAVMEAIEGAANPNYPLAENKLSLGIILGWEEANNTVTTAPMSEITTDYSSVLATAAKY